MGRRRVCAASTAAVRAVEAAVLALAREFDDQDRVLGGEADQHDEADLGQDVDVHAAPEQAGDGGEQAHRHDQHDRERQRPALVLRRQHQEDEDDRGDEDEQAGVAGELLLEGELGPLEAEAVGQALGRELLHLVERGAGRIAGRGRALHLGRRIEVVARHAIGPGDVAELGDGADRHHVAARVARLEIGDVAYVLAIGAVGLRRHPIGAAEIVELVDVGRTEIDLEGLEHAVGRDAQHLGAGTRSISA